MPCLILFLLPFAIPLLFGAAKSTRKRRHFPESADDLEHPINVYRAIDDR